MEPGQMYFTHDAAVWDAHPSLRAITVVIDDVRSLTSDSSRQERLVPAIEKRLAASSEAEMPEIAAWREAFARMGLKPTQYRCASEALLRRYRKDREMPSFHPLVDYFNFVSMAYGIPIAAFDCAQVTDGITVRPADGTESYETFQGEVENPVPGEVVFADSAGNAHSRRWTFRQSARSTVRESTERALIVSEALHADAARDLSDLGDEIRAGLAGTGATITAGKPLHAEDRRLDF